MAEWEYMDIQLYSDDGGNINGSENFDGKVKPIGNSRVLEWMLTLNLCPNHYGKKGWELIKMGRGGSGYSSNMWFLFKRHRT